MRAGDKPSGLGRRLGLRARSPHLGTATEYRTSSLDLTMPLLSTALVVVNAVLYPPFYLLSTVLLLLWTLVSPLISLGQGVLSLILLPFRILAKFEVIETLFRKRLGLMCNWQAAFIFIAAAIVTGAMLGLTLHYTSTLTVEWLHQFMHSIALSRYKDDSEEAVIKPKLEDQPQHYPQGAFEDDSLSDLTSSGDPFADWNSKKDMKSLSGTQFMSTTILEEDEYSDDSAGH